MRRRVPVLVLTMTLALAGCGGGPSGRDVLVAAPDKTVAALTSSVDYELGIEGGGREGRFNGQGVFDFAARKGRLSFDLSQLGVSGSRGRAEMLLLGNLIFLKLPLDLPQLGNRPWVKIDVDALGQQSGLALGSLGQLQKTDPTSFMELLRAVSGDVDDKGKEKVRGVETRHYATELDLDEVRRLTPPEVSGLVDQTGSDTLPVEAWVDGDGRLRRMKQTADLTKAKDPQLRQMGTVTTVLELGDFGVPVVVDPPPPEQVSDLAALTGGAGQR